MLNKRGILVFILIGTACYLFNAGFISAQSDADRIAELQRQIDELEQQAQQYRGNIASEQEKAKSLQGEISILNNQIKNIQTKINITSTTINKTGIEITGLESNIFDTQKNIDYKKNTIGELILSIYRQDNESLVEVLMKKS